ncbi:unnamed protein product, partial [Brassica oleracea var. botrytis]
QTESTAGWTGQGLGNLKLSPMVVIEGSWDCPNHHSPWPLLFDYISDLNATATHHNGYG